MVTRLAFASSILLSNQLSYAPPPKGIIQTQVLSQAGRGWGGGRAAPDGAFHPKDPPAWKRGLPKPVKLCIAGTTLGSSLRGNSLLTTTRWLLQTRKLKHRSMRQVSATDAALRCGSRGSVWKIHAWTTTRGGLISGEC